MIGLSPNTQDSDAELFTEALNVDKFSINLSENRASFGEDDPLYGFGTIYHTIEDSPYWKVPLTGVKYGG